MRRPADRVHRLSVPSELRHRQHRHSDIKNHYFALVHHDGREVVGILFIPGHSQEGRLIQTFIDDRGVFEISQVKVSHRAVLTGGCEHAFILSEADIVDSLVMSDELCLDDFLFYVPDGARGVDA